MLAVLGLVVVVIVAGAVGYGVFVHGGSSSSSPTPKTFDGALDYSDMVPPNPPDVAAAPADERTTPITGQLSVGTAAPLATQTVGTSGGTIQATGLTIKFPASAVPADTSFAITSAPITGQTFGGFITPVTPLYHVDDGDAELDAPVAVTLAAQIPSGATAMAFYYDQASGRLTPLIPDAQDASGMTVGATHFSDLFGALIDLQKIPTTVDSGFRVTKDDWQFPNEGSYIEPDGQCAGKVMSEIWYYSDKHIRGSETDHLYGTGDNNEAVTKTPGLWEDDAEAYRFTAEVQAQPWANEFVGDAYRTAKQSPDDRFTYAALRSAIALSGEPQFLSIADADDSAKHAIAVYRVEPDKLYVADPNFAGVVRTLSYDPATGKFGPFMSEISTAAIAASGLSSFTRFAYVPWRSNVSESTMAGLWAKLKAGTAGDSAFPKYQLYIRSASAPADDPASWSPLSDGQTTSESQLVIAAAVSGRLPGKRGGPGVRIQTGAPTSALGDLSYSPTVVLSEGANSVGVLEVGPRPSKDANNNPISVWKYVDFVRLTINRGPAASASPTPSVSKAPAASGSWVLDGPPIVTKPFSVDPSCYTLGGTLSEGSVSITTAGTPGSTCGGGPVHSSLSATWSPATMPPSLTPGQTLPVRLTATVSDASTGGSAIDVSFSVSTDHPNPMGVQATACVGMNDFNGEGCSGNASAEKSQDIVLDPTWAGSDQLIVQVVVKSSSGTAGYLWTYHWKP